MYWTGERLVMLFEFDDVPRGKGRFWLICDGGEVDVCVKNPGTPHDLRIASPVETLVDVWLGRRALRAAIRSGEKALEAAGGSAFFRSCPLERWLRDVRAAHFHPMQALRQYEFTGRVELGLDPVGD